MQQYVARGVHGQTVEVLAQRILNGQLAEGATLDIAALQSEFDVSLTVLREALRVLAAKGMVDARPKRGTFVRPPIGGWIRSWKAQGFVGFTFRAANSRYEPGSTSKEWATSPMPR